MNIEAIPKYRTGDIFLRIGAIGHSWWQVEEIVYCAIEPVYVLRLMLFGKYVMEIKDLYDIICKDKLLYESLLEKSVQQFSDIAELCSKLTSGNVSHLGVTIRDKAIRSAEFIHPTKKH